MTLRPFSPIAIAIVMIACIPRGAPSAPAAPHEPSPPAAAVVADAGLDATLAGLLAHDDPETRYVACLFMAELPARDAVTEALQRYVAQASDPVDRVCGQYALTTRTRGTPFTAAFVAGFPVDETYVALQARHTASGYTLGMTPPPEATMIRLAATDDVALDKLVRVIPYTGARESLQNQLAELYAFDEGRRAVIERVAEAHGVDLGFVRTTAKWLEENRPR